MRRVEYNPQHDSDTCSYVNPDNMRTAAQHWGPLGTFRDIPYYFTKDYAGLFLASRPHC